MTLRPRVRSRKKHSAHHSWLLARAKAFERLGEISYLVRCVRTTTPTSIHAVQKPTAAIAALTNGYGWQPRRKQGKYTPPDRAYQSKHLESDINLRRTCPMQSSPTSQNPLRATYLSPKLGIDTSPDGRPFAASTSTVTAECMNSDARLSPPRRSQSWKLSEPLAARLFVVPCERCGRRGRHTTAPCARCGTKSPDKTTYRADTGVNVNVPFNTAALAPMMPWSSRSFETRPPSTPENPAAFPGTTKLSCDVHIRSIRTRRSIFATVSCGSAAESSKFSHRMRIKTALRRRRCSLLFSCSGDYNITCPRWSPCSFSGPPSSHRSISISVSRRSTHSSGSGTVHVLLRCWANHT